MTTTPLTGWLPDELADELRLEFPRFAGAQFADENVRDQGRAFRRLAAQMAAPDFLARVGELVGCELEHDPEFLGAGLRGAREGAPPGWWLGRARRGWWPRAGVVVNLTPEWRDPWTGGAGAALMLGDGPLPERLPVIAPAAPERPCQMLLATLYSADPPHLDQLPLPVEEPEPLVTALSEHFGEDPAAFADELAQLRALVEARGPALERALARESQLAARFMLLVERPFWDGTGPFSADERAHVRRVLDGRDALLRQFAALESAYQDSARESRALPHPPVSGPVELERIDGYWRDRWVTANVLVVMTATARVRRVRLRGYVVRDVADPLRLTATLGDTVHRLSAPPGELSWELPASAAAGETLRLTVRASHQWIPNHDGSSPDPRALAWLFNGLDVE